MKLVWFCHSPIKSEPCGLCRPCQQKMESNMQWLLPNVSKKRYFKYKKICSSFGVKIGKLYSKVIRLKK